jgi:hypothetical protein
MNTMKFDFASPGTYGDWATYAGFNRTTGEIEPSRLAEGIAPPESMSELIDQKTAGLTKPFAAISPAMAQFGQGNIVQGINTIRGVKPKQPTTAPTTPAQPAAVDPSVHDYTYGID